MTSYGSSDENQPLTWIRGHPLYTAHAIVLVYVLSMVGTALLLFAKAHNALGFLPFTSQRVLSGEVWRVLTYGFYNPPSLGFAIDMFMIAWFGRDLEKFYGRGKLLTLFTGLYLAPPLVLTLLGLRFPSSLSGETGGFGLFIAFATLYPNVAFFFNILARWLAMIFVAIYSLIYLSQRDLTDLVALWTTTTFAFAFVRYQQGRIALPSFRRESGDDSNALRTSEKARALRTDPMAEVDALLDKIAESGIHSLTPKERAKLDAARVEMQRRDGHR
jgi:hypothetical protein